MDVFQVHQQLLADYEAFTSGFTKIHDPREVAQPAPTNDTEPVLLPAEDAGLLALVRDALDEPSATRLLGAGGEAVELPRFRHAERAGTDRLVQP